MDLESELRAQTRMKWTVFTVTLCLCGVGGLGLAVITWNSSGDTTRVVETLKTLFSSITATGVILATLFSVFQGLESSQIRRADGVERQKQREETAKTQRFANTFVLLTMWDDPALVRCRGLIRDIEGKRESLSDNELVQLIKTTVELEDSIIRMFNYWDLVRVSVTNDHSDAKVIFEQCAGPFLRTYKCFEPWIKTKSETYRRDLEKLHKAWVAGNFKPMP